MGAWSLAFDPRNKITQKLRTVFCKPAALLWEPDFLSELRLLMVAHIRGCRLVAEHDLAIQQVIA